MSGGFQYKDSELQFFPHAEGYVNAALVEVTCITCRPASVSYTRSYDYVFNYTDHLGNIRLSYGIDPSTNEIKIIEENHYYPFGLKHTNYNSDVLLYSKNSSGGTKLRFMPPLVVEPSYKYKYNGKELQDELGLNMYDYGARNYDPALGRWMNIDPLAESSRRFSPYTYALDNPVIFIDPDGMEAESFFKSKFMNENGGHWSDSYRNKESSSKNNADEPPVNVFTSTKVDKKQKPFNDVFDEANKPENYSVGDGIFSIFGHGGIGYINNHNENWDGPSAENASDFDEMMSRLSPAYKKYAKNKKLAFTLTLNSCNSATEDGENTFSLAKRISLAHPNATIIGFEGFVLYGKNSDKTPSIVGVGFSTGYDKKDNATYDRKGYIVTMKNGVIINKQLYTEYLKNKQ